MFDDVTQLFDKVIEAAANRDARVAQVEAEHDRRIEELVEKKNRLHEQLQEIDEQMCRVNDAKFSLIADARIAAEKAGAGDSAAEPF